MVKVVKSEYDNIKRMLNQKRTIEPSLSYIAECCGRSASTVCKIKNSKNYEEFRRARSYYISTDSTEIELARARAKKVFTEFNSEWFFDNRYKEGGK